MYKVYFGNRFILFSSEPDRLQKYGLFHKFHDTKEFYRIITEFQSDPVISSINVYGPNIKHIWKIFRIYFTEVFAAGGLVRHSSGRFLFIEKNGMIDFPKGHIDPGEKPEECALREVSEECGIEGQRIIKALDPVYHTYYKKGISYLKKTDWFLMDYSGEMVSDPQISEGITNVQWLSPDEISRIKDRAWLSLSDMINSYTLRP